jgi:FMN phosphatase YigB (HAD superfamily)
MAAIVRSTLVRRSLNVIGGERAGATGELLNLRPPPDLPDNRIVRQCYNLPMEGFEHVAFACRGTLVDWAGAIDAVAYELARRNGESPLDRGAWLGRRVETLAGDDGLARGFERLAAERGYLGEESGAESLARVVAFARPLHGAREAVQFAARSGRRVVAVARCESERALEPFGGAFDAVVADPRELGAPPEAIIYVSAAEWRREEARRCGMRAAALPELAHTLAARPTILAV